MKLAIAASYCDRMDLPAYRSDQVIAPSFVVESEPPFHHGCPGNSFVGGASLAWLRAIVVLCGGLTIFATRRVLIFAVCLALYHLHLLMDYYGSGPGWGIPYLWPFSPREWRNDAAWPFYSWQNISAFAVLFLWTLWIALRRGRTPLEAMMPRLDQQLVRLLTRGRK